MDACKTRETALLYMFVALSRAHFSSMRGGEGGGKGREGKGGRASSSMD